MTETKWEIRTRQFSHCTCAYGCPCQFNALPTHGYCRAVIGFEIDQGFHGDTRLDGLKVAMMAAFPGALHEGHGEAATIIDQRATEAQRSALLRILSGKDAEPGTFFSIIASLLEKIHDPIFADIDFDIDIERRRARILVPGHMDARGEPILNPVTGAEHRVRIDMPEGFEYRLAEAGRGWAKTSAPMQLEMANSYAHFCRMNLSQSGVID